MKRINNDGIDVVCKSAYNKVYATAGLDNTLWAITEALTAILEVLPEIAKRLPEMKEENDDF